MIYILPEVIRNTKSDKFIFMPWMLSDTCKFDVYYNHHDIATINGKNSPLVWTASNMDRIPPAVIQELEDLVKDMVARSNPQNKFVFVTVEEFLYHGGVLETGREIYSHESKFAAGIYDEKLPCNEGCIGIKNTYGTLQVNKHIATVQIMAKPIYK